jgi:hypothetical protein
MPRRRVEKRGSTMWRKRKDGEEKTMASLLPRREVELAGCARAALAG